MLPNSSASKDGPLLPKRVSSATPSAKDAVVTTPIAASAPMRRLRATALMASADASPHSPARARRAADERCGGVAAEARVRQAVADVAHAAQDDEDPDETAEAPARTAATRPLTKNS
jgi:hypothetical protein